MWDLLEHHANGVQVTVVWVRDTCRQRRARVRIHCCTNATRVSDTVVQVQVKLFGKLAWYLCHANLRTARRHTGNLELCCRRRTDTDSAVICIEWEIACLSQCRWPRRQIREP